MPEQHNRVADKAEFSQTLLDNALAIADRQMQGMTLQPDQDGLVDVEIAVPMRVRVRVQTEGEPQGRILAAGPPGETCCVCTRDGSGTVHCWGASSRPCC